MFTKCHVSYLSFTWTHFHQQGAGAGLRTGFLKLLLNWFGLFYQERSLESKMLLIWNQEPASRQPRQQLITQTAGCSHNLFKYPSLMLIFPGSLNGTNGEITLVEKGACKHIGWVFFFFPGSEGWTLFSACVLNHDSLPWSLAAWAGWLKRQEKLAQSLMAYTLLNSTGVLEPSCCLWKTTSAGRWSAVGVTHLWRPLCRTGPWSAGLSLAWTGTGCKEIRTGRITGKSSVWFLQALDRN